MSAPFVWKNNLTLSFKPFETKHLDRLRPFNGFANMGIALANLGVGSGQAFGWNQDRIGFAASLTKIAAMYAAFHLQASLRKVPEAGSLKTPALQKHLQEEWRPELKRILGGTAARNDFPQLAKIFTPDNASFPFNSVFSENLKGMIGPSHNYNARYCIQAIGFDYLAAALIHGGFYSLADKRGLWLSGNYDGIVGNDGAPAPGVTTIADASQRHQVATAAAVTLFMANLGLRQLIDEPASVAMQGLMTNSYAGRRLGSGGNTVVGKLGIQPNNASFHDCAIVERHCMRYSMTVLFMPNSGTTAKPLIESGLFAELDSIADEVFGVSRDICELAHRLPTVIKSIF